MVQLVLLLASTCPPELEVLVAPVDWRPDRRTSLQPDVLVAPARDAAAPNITDPLALAVAVLSPSTRTKDRTWKRQKYEQAGVRSFWIVDPDVPSIEAWLLVDGRFQLEGAGVGDDVTLEHPFGVTVRPADLIRR